MPADVSYQSIGGSYNETNVQRLCLPKWRPEAKVYGTAKGITSAERIRIYADRLGNRPDMTFGDDYQDAVTFLRHYALLP